METTTKIPFYAQVALIFICLFAFVFTLHIGQQIIIPIVYATLMAILLNPLVNFLIRKKLSKILSISMATLLAVVVLFGSLYVVSSQIAQFGESYPQLKVKFSAISLEFLHWVSQTFNIKLSSVNLWATQTQTEAIQNFEIGESLSGIGHILVVIMLLPVYFIMILFYKPLLLEFIHRLFHAEHHTAVAQVLNNTKHIIQTYLVGLFIELIIMAVLNSVGLLLLGIKYAIILGILGAILNIIPYIGGIVATVLAMLVAFATKDSLTYPVLVFVLYILIQFIDNNFIVPKIVASRVQINALVSVIAVLIGGAIWGISGMFLSIPLTAILKVIFDHIDPLKPWGFLLGNIVPTATKFSFIKKKTPVGLSLSPSQIKEPNPNIQTILK
jgi:predicted PurR-regulated permease PerM